MGTGFTGEVTVMNKKNRKLLKIAGIVAAVLVVSFAVMMSANAYFRETVVVAVSSKDASVVSLDKTAANVTAAAPTIDTHFGDWTVGDPLVAEINFTYTGNISAYVAPQLDIIGSDGTNYNANFTGTYQIGDAFYTFAEEQTSEVIVTGSSAVQVVYTLAVADGKALPAGVTITPEFSAAALQAVHNDGIEASCRKILSEDQTGFHDSIAADGVYCKDDTAVLLKDKYAAATYTAKTLDFTVKPDNKATEHKTTVYKLIDPLHYTNFSSVGYKLKDAVTDTEFSLPFAAREGMSCTVVVDAENREAGHAVFKYDITWPAGGALSVATTELDKNGNLLSAGN